ncbi:MAG: TonB-dependent receptor plug domain-containing protein, partial [Polymorphobacter sp.]
MRIKFPMLAVLLGSAAGPVLADVAAPGADTALHSTVSAEIIVTAPYARDRATTLSGVTVLQGTDLIRELRGTIGDTLSRQAGVSSTSFGPNASRPVLRGFQGERIRILNDGIGSFDVSNTSVDHAVVINPQLAERIEVLRGPASLLYGSSAIGGVVNVIDKRIPREVPTEPVHVDVLGSFGSAATERNISGVFEMPVSDRIVLHADASLAKSDDLRIGGFLLSRPVRAAALASADPGVRALAALDARLPNSAARTWTAGGGAAFIDADGELGFAYSHYDSLYGVPPRFDLATGDGEAVRLKVKQDRIDLRGQINAGGSL